jgi:transposase InsO family protein
VHVQQKYGTSERRACKALGVFRSVQRYQKRNPDDEAHLRKDITHLALKYGRYGYKRITSLLHVEGWRVNYKRVERIWREEGLRGCLETPSI